MKTWLVSTLMVILLGGVGFSSVKITDVLNFLLPANHYELKHAAYGSGLRQQMDIYVPRQDTGKPPVIFVYGGAWREGDKQDYEFVAHALTGLGYPVIIPDYRLYPEVRFPGFVVDVADAIQYLDRHAPDLLGKPLQRYILMGHSAGAHTAALLATDERYLQERGLYTRLAALIALAGPYDLNLDDPEVVPVFAGANAELAKPVRNVHPGMPPVLLLHGEADERVYPFHTQRFTEVLHQRGNTVQTRIYPGIDHVRIIGSLAAPLRLLNSSYQDIQQFLASIH